jgi:hypothetical protein
MYKRNQIEEAIGKVLERESARLSSARLSSATRTRFKRLLDTDRGLGRYKRSSDPERAHFAFYTGEALGRGVENWFSHYEAFAVLIGLRLMRHGFPQGGVVTMLRRMKPGLAKQHALILKQDRAAAFDDQQILVRAKPGDLVVGTTHPVFLVLSSPDGEIRSIAGPAAICQGQKELMLFIKAQGVGQTWTVFELVNSIHALSSALAKTKPLKRGRGN